MRPEEDSAVSHRWRSFARRLLCVLVLALPVGEGGCGGDSRPSPSTETRPDNQVQTDRVPPAILEVALLPASGNPLAAVLSLTASEPVTCTLVAEELGTGRSWTITPDFAAATDHVLPILGLRASQSYEFSVGVYDGADNVTWTDHLSWQTDELPEGIPVLTLLESRPEEMAPGLTLLNLIQWGADVFEQGILLAVDDEGEVVWLHQSMDTLVEARFTSHGTLVVAYGDSDGIREIDMLGNVLREWKPADLGLDGLHHAVGPGPEDSIVSLAPELRWIDGYVQEDGSMTGYWVVGDVAVELPRNGPPVRTWSLLDVLDPYHYNPNFFFPFWFLLYPDAPGGAKDWSHANAIQYNNDDNSYVISLANQDLVVKLDRDSGELLWSLGETGDVELAPGGSWFSVPHGAEWLPDGQLILYDDGVFKAERRSRIVEYTLSAPQDNGPWHAVESWSWDGGSSPFYSMGPADVDVLPNDNLLVLHGSLVEDPEASPFGDGNNVWVRVEEIRRDPAGERVFGLDIGGPMDPAVEKVTAFALERLPGLYPVGWDVGMREMPAVNPCSTTCAGKECGWLDGCVCGICNPGAMCLQGACEDCTQACAELNLSCGQISSTCSCGDCPDGLMCDETGACEDESVFCAPFCEGRECGVVGAFYRGQSCDCGVCPEGMACDEASATCV